MRRGESLLSPDESPRIPFNAFSLVTFFLRKKKVTKKTPMYCHFPTNQQTQTKKEKTP